VDLHIADRDLLLKAIQALGYKFVFLKNGNVAVSTDAGQIILGAKEAVLRPEAQHHLNAIKRSYSRHIISQVAKKYKLTETEKEEDYVILRGY
jgi:hypothetical protein